MIGHDWRLEYSVRFYRALLSLYPVPFRVRFGPEMMQVFRASLRSEARHGRPLRLARWWLQTFKDLVVSISREHGRDLMGPLGASHPVVALVDSLLIPGIVGINLIVLGPMVTALLLRMQPTMVSPDEFFTTSVISSLVLGGLGILRAVVLARLRPTVRLWVKLS
jgi:hypothetical protein